jgi:hypothetical protein
MLPLLRRLFGKRRARDEDRLLRGVRDPDVSRAWDALVSIWGQATIVYRHAVRGPSLPLELAALIEFLHSHQGSDRVLYQGLLDQDPRVAAYALVALGLVDSPLVGELPMSLLERTDLIQWKLAGRAGTWTLGELARAEMSDREGRAWLRNHPGLSVTEQYLGLLEVHRASKK